MSERYFISFRHFYEHYLSHFGVSEMWRFGHQINKGKSDEEFHENAKFSGSFGCLNIFIVSNAYNGSGNLIAAGWKPRGIHRRLCCSCC